MTRLAALTGGTGFLGRHVMRALADQGWRLRILARSTPDLPELSDTPFEVVRGDLQDAEALSALARGADVFIHIAGVVKAASRDRFMAPNRDGAALAARCWANATTDGRFVLISSMAARAPDLSFYAESKRAAESVVAEVLSGRSWRILRPGAIYGAHDQESLKVLKLSNMPVQLMLNAPSARVAMVDARDAAAAVAAVAARDDPGAIHEISDVRRDGYRWDELAAVAARALGRTPRPVRLPAVVLKTIGAIGGAVGVATGNAEMLTAGKVREILHPDWSVDPRHALPDEIYRPQIPLDRGLRDMARASGLFRGQDIVD